MHVCAHVRACMRGMKEVALVLQALKMALVSPAWSPRQILPAFSQIQNLMQDVTWDSRHPHFNSKPNCLQKKEAG